MATDIEKVRLLISDVGGESGSEFLFEDTDIDTFLEMSPNVFNAAAVALRTIASNEAQVAKRIKFLELETDGPAVAKELRMLADSFDKSADDLSEWDIANMGADFFARRELRMPTF
jgi:hypothetical protein